MEEKINILYKGNGTNADKVIVIDAGHQHRGMTEPEPNGPGSEVMKAKVTGGTVGNFTGLKESILNLRVSEYMRDILLAKGYSVVMVRESEDVKISNIERAEMANAHNAAVFVRVHANSSSDPETSGALTICQTAQNPYNGELYGECRKLSEIMLDVFCRVTGMNKCKIWETDTMTGINWCKVPATIMEMGFMSNEHDDRLLNTDEFQHKAAEAMCEGIEEYLNSK